MSIGIIIGGAGRAAKTLEQKVKGIGSKNIDI